MSWSVELWLEEVAERMGKALVRADDEDEDEDVDDDAAAAAAACAGGKMEGGGGMERKTMGDMRHRSR
jgi:hypothetical protein